MDESGRCTSISVEASPDDNDNGETNTAMDATISRHPPPTNSTSRGKGSFSFSEVDDPDTLEINNNHDDGNEDETDSAPKDGNSSIGRIRRLSSTSSSRATQEMVTEFSSLELPGLQSRRHEDITAKPSTFFETRNKNNSQNTEIVVNSDALQELDTLIKSLSIESSMEGIEDDGDQIVLKGTHVDINSGLQGDVSSPNAMFAVQNPMNPIEQIGSPVEGMPRDILVTEEITSPSMRSISSIEDFAKALEKLPSRFKHNSLDDSGTPLPQEKLLSRLDGIHPSSLQVSTLKKAEGGPSSEVSSITPSRNTDANGSVINHMDDFAIPVKPVVIRSMEVAAEQQEEVNTIGSWFTYFMGSMSKDDHEENNSDSETQNDGGHGFSVGVPVGSSPIDPLVPKPSAGDTFGAQSYHSNNYRLPSYPEAYRENNKPERKLSDWIDNKFIPREVLPNDGTYRLAESKTIVVHEILRGNWTWCTAWSPDGKYLAIATENHHLAVVDTVSSSVWRVKHDKKVVGPPKQATTQSIRSIAWGEHYIAVGGIGDAVSILAPTEPYQILHTITPTGFVGSIDWLVGSNKLMIGSRDGKATIHEIWANHDAAQNFQFSDNDMQAVQKLKSKTIHTIDRGKAWVNAVRFKPGDTFLAIADSHGILAVFSFEDEKLMELTNVANFKLEDSILDIEWSLDGKYLYAGGEDFAVTVIITEHWEPVHKIKRDRWVQTIASSHGSSHVAVGGVTSEVAILEVKNGWDNIINVGLKGLVPLSANWHPNDQYLVLTGQSNSILAVETTNVRHVSGHFLRSAYPILSISFSPDGRMVAIGNEMGVITFFTLSGTSFASAYEMVIDCNGSLSIEWSSNGTYVAIAGDNKVVIVARTETLPGSAPPNTSGFFVAKVIRDLGGAVYDVSIDPTSRFLAVSGTQTRILDATSGFKHVMEMENGGTTLANAWSPDGKWFAVIGKDHSLVIYDTADTDLLRWESVFTIKTEGAGLALAWGQSSLGGLQYCAYGGEDKQVHIIEIRTKERSWETVLTIPRDGEINGLDLNKEGLLAAAISNGTVTILDLSYLQSGWAVNEMDYNWQRQALTCATEIRRNKGKHSMKSVKWIPSGSSYSDSFLAIGGTDGEVEIIDLTHREKCKGYQTIDR